MSVKLKSYILSEKHEWLNVIKRCFEQDPSLLEKYHVCAGSGLDICVSDTWNKLMEVSEKHDFNFFQVMNPDGDLAGYFGHEKRENTNILTGFFIMPFYRTDEGRDKFWELITDAIGKEFITGIYKKNMRAHNFLINRGGEVVKEDKDQSGEYSVIKITDPCQSSCQQS